MDIMLGTAEKGATANGPIALLFFGLLGGAEHSATGTLQIGGGGGACALRHLCRPKTSEPFPFLERLSIDTITCWRALDGHCHFLWIMSPYTQFEGSQKNHGCPYPLVKSVKFKAGIATGGWGANGAHNPQTRVPKAVTAGAWSGQYPKVAPHTHYGNSTPRVLLCCFPVFHPECCHTPLYSIGIDCSR